jgi:hypothetical protein
MMKNLLTRIKHLMGMRSTSKDREKRVFIASDQQSAAEMDDAQGRALKRLINELEMLKVAIEQTKPRQAKPERRGNY